MLIGVTSQSPATADNDRAMTVITAGVDATHFAPLSICNRAQVVTFLYRVDQK